MCIRDSLRLEKTWKTGPYNVFYSTHADYNGSFNTEKIDPDINRHKEDSYKSRINRLSWINNIEWQSENQTAFFNSLSFNSSISFSKDKVDEVRYNSCLLYTSYFVIYHADNYYSLSVDILQI